MTYKALTGLAQQYISDFVLFWLFCGISVAVSTFVCKTVDYMYTIW